jgi:hypothetical protein
MAMGTLILAAVLAASPLPADVTPMNARSFRIPIRIDPAHRAEIKELHLFASTDEGRTWQQVAVAATDQDGFPFYAPADGVYWFSVQVVDQHGNLDPPDIYKVPPSQKVLVDTLKPVLRVVSAERQGDDVVVDWEVQEDHPDLGTLRLEYRTADGPANVWTPVSLVPTLVGQARFRPGGAGALALRMQIQDLAGNQAVAGTDLVGAPPAAPGPQLTAAAPAPVPPSAAPMFPPAAPSPPAPTPPADPLPPPQSWGSSQAYTPPAPHTEPRLPPPAPPPAAAPDYQLVSATNADPNSRLVASSSNPAGLGGRVPSGGHPSADQLPPVQLVNSPQVTINYEVTKAGPSGIGKVELWMTRDDGHTWQPFAEDPDLKPPMTVELPGEGVYGFSVVLQSRAGLKRRAPGQDEPPEIRVEVDTTPPDAKLWKLEPDPTRRDTLIWTWTVSDRNLGPNPVTLQWAEKRDGSWQTVAADLPNTGRYAWQLQPNIPYRIYLRLIAHDRAGNISVAETDTPQLIDLREPEGRLTGIVTHQP